MSPTARQRRLQDELAQRLVSALKQPQPDVRQLARQVVDLRAHFEHEGRPDWAGRSQEYRDTIYRVYRDAQVPPDSGGGLQANLRYHVGNVLREVAPPEDLLALGLKPQGPRGRAVEARKNPAPRPPAPPLTALNRANDPLALAGFALEAVRALRAMKPRGEMAEPVEAELHRLMDELVDALAEVRAAGRRHTGARAT